MVHWIDDWNDDPTENGTMSTQERTGSGNLISFLKLLKKTVFFFRRNIIDADISMSCQIRNSNG